MTTLLRNGIEFLPSEIVIPGLDPGIYLDCRVKPGNDEEKSAECSALFRPTRCGRG
jgi:hypothetical protein